MAKLRSGKEGKDGRTSISVEESILIDFTTACENNDRSRSAVLREFMLDYIKRDNELQGKKEVTKNGH